MKIISLLLSIFTSATITSASVIQTRQILSSSEVCQTPGCIKTAEQLLRNMDTKVNPCDDFYKFACGGYMEKRTIPDEKSTIGVFQDIQDELNNQMKELLKKPLTGTEPKFVKMVKDMYDSCMNLDTIEEAKEEPLKKVLNSIGGWPVVEGESWDASKFDWIETLFKLKNLGFDHNILVSEYVFEDLRNNTVHIINLDQTLLGMPDREYLLKGLNDNATKAYFNLMVNAANKLGANKQSSEKELMNALNFEITLANYSLPNEERRNFSALYNKLSVKELTEIAPQVDWLKLLIGLTDHLISDLEKTNVAVPNFVKKFAELIDKTDKRTVANYMMWRAVLSSIPHLSKEWRDMMQDYDTQISGSLTEKPRYEKCVDILSENIGIAVGSYYVRNYFDTESKEKALEIVKYLRKEFMTMLDENDWMDEATKIAAKTKADAIIPFIGYPEELLDDAKVMGHFENLTITSDSFFANMLNLEKWQTDTHNAKLRKPKVKGEWKNHADAAMVNAFYNILENTIDFPAGILQKDFFTKDRPFYMNFGGIGYVIGHEITHGFDDMGRQFDKDGNNNNWWDETTDQHFTEKAKCIIEQYGNYTADNGMKLNGINTQGENIADNGGLKEAYRAYRSWLNDHSPEPKLPGLDYTPGQLFWISAANVWCSKYRPESLKLEIISGAHSPGPFKAFFVRVELPIGRGIYGKSILKQSITFQNILECYGIFGNIPDHCGTFQNTFECCGIFWNIVDNSKTFFV